MTFDAVTVVFFVMALIPAIILHEVSHGLVAYAFGDPTAKEAGRLTLNPLRHIDPFGTVILPGLLLALAAAGLGSGIVFGYAKPVPVNGSLLRRPRLQMLLVSLAGPATNLSLVILGGLVLRWMIPTTNQRLVQFLVVWILVNVILAIFNLLPLPPLDGSELIAAALPDRARLTFRRFQPYAFLVLFVLLFSFPGALDRVISPVFDAVLRLVAD